MRTALTKRGVAVIVIPGDVALRECSAPALSLGIETSASLLFHRTTNFAMPPRFLTTRKITILGGVGCEGAHAELITAAERLKAPIVHALRARNLLLGFSSGCHAMMNCDALLMLGTDLPYQQFYPRSLKIIQVDRLGEQIGRRTPVDLGLIGNVRDTLERLNPLIESRTDRTYSIHDSRSMPTVCRFTVDSRCYEFKGPHSRTR
jgi:pyruvate dehydrogenase (quinone)